MKYMFPVLFCCLATYNGFSQLKTTPVCNSFSVDILSGKVNGVEPDFTQGQIKKVFPCFSSEAPETAGSNCGGFIFYKDRDLYFYTGRDYVEIRDKFKGKLSIPLMGASRNSLFKWLGLPKIKDVKWDAFQMAYGTLILYYNNASRIDKIQFSTQSTESIQLCQ